MLAADCTGSIDNNDYLMIEAKFDDGGLDEWCYLTTAPATDLEINTTLYPYWVCRYKCSANDVNAKVEIQYNGGGGVETLFAATNSNLWTVASGTITNASSESEIDHIRFYADDILVTLASTRYVYFDFILFCTGAFTFPHQAHGITTDFPPKEAFLPIPHRDTNITQNLGSKNAVVNIGCNLDIGIWKRTSPADNKDGDVFRDILHNRSSEPWQWLDYDEGQMKATIHPEFSTVPSGGRLERRVDLTCTEYSLSNKDAETYIERFGLNL